MKINKSELATKIGQLKNVVPKQSTIEALKGILVKDGYLIGNNNEMTVMVKLEGTENESFIIPAKAFDFISSLPAGDVEIGKTGDSNSIKITSNKIKNVFKSLAPEQFSYRDTEFEADRIVTISSDKLKECIKHVIFAVSNLNTNPMMNTVSVNCHDGYINFCGLDGHEIAWDKTEYEGEFKFMIPKNTAEKILSLDLKGDVSIRTTDNSAVFETDDYIVETRLVSGNYFNYEKMFTKMENVTLANRKELLDAIKRASLCMDDVNTSPIIMSFSNDCVDITVNSRTASYEENIKLSKPIKGPIRIGFAYKLLIGALQSFSSDEVILSLESPKKPLQIETDECELKALVLPVAIRE